MQTVEEIKKRLSDADAESFAVLERSLVADSRKGVRTAVEVTRRRIQAQEEERRRLASMYTFEKSLSKATVVVGLDEVGRGPLAGPLAVGAVVLPDDPLIEGLNDSKKIAPKRRVEIAEEIKQHALVWVVEYIEPDAIDAAGMAASLRVAFSRAIKAVDDAGYKAEAVLVDGNPLYIDKREIAVVKGDGKCASIAAASIVAKVERDNLMREYAHQYPEYTFDKSKGYASADHIEAIKKHGLCPIHRKSFCTAFLQESLF